MDGLILKITNDLISILERKGLTVKNIRVKQLSRDSRLNSVDFKSYSDSSNFYAMSSAILNSSSYLCSAGTFPVIENLVVVNNNLPFGNQYSWSNITDRRTVVSTLDTNNFENYEAEIQRYLTLMLSSFDEYTRNINDAIKVRLNAYVDPCYVDAGYVSPN